MTEREISRGATLLDAFVRAQGRGMAAKTARALGVSPPTIHDWMSGVKRPKGPRREALEVWTGGAVPRDAWDLDGERDVLTTVRPFEPPAATSSPSLPTAADSGPALDEPDATGTEG